VIVKGHQQLEAPRAAVRRAELRESLIELWAQVFERELRAELESAAPPAVGNAMASTTARASRDGETGTLQGGHE
jgi:hypothetical protein